MSALVTTSEHGPWTLCPRCRVYVDRLTAEAWAMVHERTRTVDLKCPWCHLLSTLPQWLEAAARDVCACGCPRAAHAGVTTSDGLPPGSGGEQRIRAHAAPCVSHACTACSGAREVRES